MSSEAPDGVEGKTSPGEAGVRRTKLVCTIGPASAGRLPELIAAGLDVARVNFSHGTREEWLASVDAIRRSATEARRTVAILADLSGPKVRLGELAEGSVQLQPGGRFVLRTQDGVGDASGASTNHRGLARDLRPGDRVLLADGAVELRVVETSNEEAEMVVVRGGLIRSHAGVNAPSERLSLPGLTDKDRLDARVAVELGVDLVAQSFVRRPEDILELRQLLGQGGPPIIAKIETGAAVAAMDAILKVADGVMVARGDLGVEVPFEEVPPLQKALVRQALGMGKPSIVATQMLESMINAPRPTRAEASDVANAVLDGADAVMLSAETAIGSYPLEATAAAVAIVRAAESGGSYGGSAGTGTWTQNARPHGAIGLDAAEPIIWAAAALARRESGIRAIATFTRSGLTAELLSALRPSVPIVALSPKEGCLRRLSLWNGVVPRLAGDAHGTDEIIALMDQELRHLPFLQSGDPVLVVASSPSGVPGANLLELHRLP
jgi:pyruvate kinase